MRITAKSFAFTRTKFEKQAAPRKACVCCAWKRMIPSPPPLSCRKKTKKEKSSWIWRLSRERGARFIVPLLFPRGTFLTPHEARKDVRILGLMKNIRRILAVLLVLSAPLVLSSSVQTSEKTAASSRYLGYVGKDTTKTWSK